MKEYVDVCGPNDKILKECKKLEDSGYLLTGQIGGGELGSCLVYEDYKNASLKDRDVIMAKHYAHMKVCQNFWAELSER